MVHDVMANAGNDSTMAAHTAAIGRKPMMVAGRVLMMVMEYVAAALVLAEAAVLLAGVVFRYALHDPLVWSDELATFLFLWLGMLGAVIASYHGDHMRMTAFVSRRAPRTRARFQAVCAVAEVGFLICALPPAIDYAQDARIMLSATLQISMAWRAAALPAGIALMMLIGLTRLTRPVEWIVVAIACVLSAVAVTVDFDPPLAVLGNLNLVLFFVIGVGLAVLSGLPIAFSFGLATFAYISLGTDAPPMVLIGRLDEGMSHIILLAVPMFVFLGMLIEMTGMARALVAFLASLLGHVRGGLSYVLVGAMYLVSGISGSKAADMAAVAPALFPAMKERGAKPGDLVALLSATGAQTETVPPSLVLITIGAVSGLSIADLFTGGLLPSLVLAIGLCLVVWWHHRGDDLSHSQPATLRVRMRTLGIALPALVLPIVIRGAVMEGVATATEVSTLGIVYTAFFGATMYRFDLSRLKALLVATAALSGAILMIVGFATAMAWALTQSNFSQNLAALMEGLPAGGAGFMVASIAIFIVLGSVLEGIPVIVLLGPLFFPIAKALGLHEIHYAMVVILSMGIGLFMPPFGIGYYTACAIGRVDPEEGLPHIRGYLAALVVGLAIVAAFPWLSVGLL